MATKKTTSRGGRRFAELVRVLHTRIESDDASIATHAIDTLTRILCLIETTEDAKAGRAARRTSFVPETTTPDPDKIAALVAELKAEAERNNAS
jgi:hypothetical protein